MPLLNLWSTKKSNGDVYDGGYKDGKRHGKGTYKYPNGSVYEGGWENGAMHGKGTYKYPNDDVYVGDWENDKMHGEGTLKFADGDVYEGGWEKGAMHGKGTSKDANGYGYEGTYEDGKKHGKGTLTDANGSVYDVVMKDGEFLSKEAHVSPFFAKLTEIEHTNQMDYNSALELSSHVENIWEMKLLYTLVATSRRMGVFEEADAGTILCEGLKKTAETCIHEDAIVSFKLILDKALKDGFITQGDLYRFDNRGEVKRIENAPFIKSMMEAIKSNTRHIESIEANVVAINDSVNKLKVGLKKKMQAEVAVGCIICIVNVMSLGVGGSLIKGAELAVIDSIIDFGDVQHIKDAVKAIAPTVQDVAIGKATDQDLEKAIEEQNILVVVTAVSHVVSAGYSNDRGQAYTTDGGECNEVETWLKGILPGLPDEDLSTYMNRFGGDGFDSVASIQQHLEAVDLVDMKKAHRRALMEELGLNDSREGPNDSNMVSKGRPSATLTKELGYRNLFADTIHT